LYVTITAANKQFLSQKQSVIDYESHIIKRAYTHIHEIKYFRFICDVKWMCLFVCLFKAVTV